jgi:hypothetical protein
MENSMAVPSATRTGRIVRVPILLKQSMLYWIPTLYLVVTNLASGTTDILHAPPLYAETFAAGVPAALCHAARRLEGPRGGGIAGAWVSSRQGMGIRRLFIDFSAGVVAYAAAGDGIASYIGPVVSMGALIASWYLRPQSRRLPD